MYDTYSQTFPNTFNENAQDWLKRTNQTSIIDELSSDKSAQSSESPSMSKDDKQNIARGAIQGGKSGIAGALMGGGMAAGIGAIGAEAGSAAAAAGPWGWAALGAGALISELESQKEAEALQEQANIQAETDRRQNVQKAGNSLLAMFNSMGNMKA